MRRAQGALDAGARESLSGYKSLRAGIQFGLEGGGGLGPCAVLMCWAAEPKVPYGHVVLYVGVHHARFPAGKIPRRVLQEPCAAHARRGQRSERATDRGG